MLILGYSCIVIYIIKRTMIDEITHPLPTIFEHIQQKRVARKVRKKIKGGLSEYDVTINNDPLLIEEFSKRCDIDKDFGKRLLIAFFEIIKKALMDGKIISIHGFGKFYTNGPRKNQYRQLTIPTSRSTIEPTFKANLTLKNKFKNSSK